MNNNSESAKQTRKLCEALHAQDRGYKAASNIDFALFLVGLVLVMLIIRAFIFEPVRVDGPSMMNTLIDGERCICEKVSHIITEPKQGDIVIVRFPDRGTQAFVKRVIATAGQTVSLGTEIITDPVTKKSTKRYYVIVDGKELDESAYSDGFLYDDGASNIPITCEGSSGGSYTVPEGCVFVMGDHRTNSQDSRRVGAIPLSDVVGRVHGVMYPFNRIRSVK